MTKQELIDQILSAKTKQQVIDAEKAIKKYNDENGVDIDVLEAGEQLALMKQVVKK